MIAARISRTLIQRGQVGLVSTISSIRPSSCAPLQVQRNRQFSSIFNNSSLTKARSSLPIRSTTVDISLYPASESSLSSTGSLSGSLLGSSISPVPFMFPQTIQRRWKARGNTYQPNSLKRKRRFGFLARLRSKTGRKILKRRTLKGRWYLTH
ncbi:mitochondrial 54S ribosomal protein bL34m [Lipomyces oligophaga]|uniref:mitochondrial 54S ribosomal protein bL34m n=1 Tax=Lipomyces oligophaga TaxID=45792 RepID=UPI0034CE600A